MAKNEPSYAAGLVRTHDRDRFALALTAPRDRREDLFALFAFNYDIARTRETVTQPTLGLIRLQWWRDALAAFYRDGTVPAHEIMAALAPVIRARALPPEEFEALLAAREFDLESRPPATLADMESYAAATTAPLGRMALRVLGDDAPDKAVDDLSAAWGLTGLLRAVPFHAGQGRCYLPAELTEADSLSSANLHRPEKRAAVAAVAASIAARAETLQQSASGLPNTWLRATARLTGLYLSLLKKRHYDLFSPGLQSFPVSFSVRALIGRF